VPTRWEAFGLKMGAPLEAVYTGVSENFGWPIAAAMPIEVQKGLVLLSPEKKKKAGSPRGKGLQKVRVPVYIFWLAASHM
jgi:hypothetical protein